jgi:hypothetical protein
MGRFNTEGLADSLRNVEVTEEEIDAIKEKITHIDDATVETLITEMREIVSATNTRKAILDNVNFLVTIASLVMKI